MPIARRLIALAILSLAAASATADSLIKLSSFPSISVGDGKSTVTITAEIRDQNGRNVQDGTRVVFDTSLGTFRENSAATVSGIARVVLVAPTTAGIATITATADGIAAAPTTLTYEFVGSRSELLSAKEYVEIVSPGYMQYMPVTQIVGAASPNGGVSLRYRGISLTADDIQYDIRKYEVRGRKVKLKIGTFEKEFDELNFKLLEKKGIGTTLFKAKRTNTLVTQGIGLAFVRQGADGKLVIPPDEDRYGLVDVHSSSVTPSDQHSPTIFFTFDDLSHAPSTISARKAIIFPKRKIQFQRAQIFIAGKKIWTIPLMEYSLVTETPLVTEQMLAVNDSQIEVNYPYILSMKPGQTSLLRFWTGEQEGRGDIADRGAFLDYELDWDKGDDMQGKFVFSGIGRDDWTVGLDEFVRIDDRTSASLQLLSPTGTSFFGTAIASHQFNGFSVSMNGDASRTTQGIQYTTDDYSATIAKDPMKVGTLPVKLYLELTATSSYNQLLDQTQSGAGARARFQSLPLPLNPSTTVTSSFTTSYLQGLNEPPGLQYLATASLSHLFNSAMSAVFTYNFTRDGFNQYVIGEHEVTLQGTYKSKWFTLSATGSKSLDLERSTLFVDLGYKLSNLWRLTTGYTYDNYLETTFIDYNFGFGYRLGWREVGLIWTEQTQRIGFQFLGTTVF